MLPPSHSNPSSLSRTKIREMTIQLLYSTLFQESSLDEEVIVLSEVHNLTEEQILELKERVRTILHHRQSIYDQIVENSSANFYGEIQSIERIIIEQAIYELLYSKQPIDLPLAVSEALRLAHRFEVPQAVTFLNGLLSAIYKKQFPDAILPE